jgi:predicted amidohydrolase
MPKNVLIGVWSYTSFRHYGSPSMGAVKSLTDALQETAKQVALYRPQLETSNAFEAIFVAPEYLFVGKRDKQRRAAMRATSKDNVYAALRGLSSANPKILIIAGSAFWREQLDTEEQQNKYKANVVAATMKATNFGKQDNPRLIDGWTQQKVQKRVPGLAELTATIPRYRAYNTVYAFLNGQSAFAPYNKECDFLEAWGADPEKMAYVPGSAGGIREVGGYKFGLEICYDHANNTLQGKVADFHVVVSDWVPIKPAQNVGQYLIHASSMSAQSGVWGSSGAQPLPSVNNMKPSDEGLVHWLCPIDPRNAGARTAPALGGSSVAAVLPAGPVR